MNNDIEQTNKNLGTLKTDPPKKIAIFRALQLGDMLCSIPAIRSLRKTYPNAEITLIGLPWAKSLLSRFPAYFDRVIDFKGWPGLPEQEIDSIAIIKQAQEIQNLEFDLILQMQGNGNLVNPMVELWAGKVSAGFYLPTVYYPNNGFFILYPNHLHEIERHLELMNYIGVPTFGYDMEFPIYEKDEQEFKELQLNVKSQKYVCIHPGSRGDWRQWPVGYFAKLGNYCAEKNMRVLITGTEEEIRIVQQVADLMNYDAIIVAGKTTLGSMAVLIENAFVLISNCTGPSHIAAALKTPSVVISMDGEPERWAPLNKQLHRTIDWTKTPDFNLVFEQLIDIFSNYPKKMI